MAQTEDRSAGTRHPKERLLRNVFSNWLALAISAGIAFYMSPFLVHHLGKEAYGVWALVFSVIAYTDFFDVGMRQSLARYLPKYYAVSDWVNLNRVINTAGVMYSVIGTLTLLSALALAFFSLGLFNVSAGLIQDMRIAMIIIGANAALVFYCMAPTAIGPFHRYDIGNAIHVSLLIVSTVFIVYYLSHGHGLVTLAVITFAATIVRQVVKRVAQQRIVPEIRFSTRYVNRETMREMLSYGTISFLIVLSWLVIFNTDNVIIGIFLSAEAVTYYAIAMTVVQYLRSLINAIGVPLVPAISHLEATSDLTAVSGLSSKMLRYLYYLCACLCCGILVFGAEFVNLWMGPGFGLTVKILYVLVIGAAVYLPQVASNSVLLGIGRHRLLLYILAAEALGNVVLSVILVKTVGIIGVAWGTVIPQLLVYIFVYPIAYHRILKADVKSFYGQALRVVLIAVAITVPTALAVKHVLMVQGWVSFFADIGITAVIFLVGFFLFILDPSDRKRILAGLVGRSQADA